MRIGRHSTVTRNMTVYRPSLKGREVVLRTGIQTQSPKTTELLIHCRRHNTVPPFPEWTRSCFVNRQTQSPKTTELLAHYRRHNTVPPFPEWTRSCFANRKTQSPKTTELLAHYRRRNTVPPFPEWRRSCFANRQTQSMSHQRPVMLSAKDTQRRTVLARNGRSCFANREI